MPARSTLLPPPPLSACLSVNDPQAIVIARSDAETVRGGTPIDGLLPVVFSPVVGLDPHRYRTLARAWRRRSASMEAERLEHQATLGATPEDAVMLMRWLAARSELRTLRLLMRKMR